MTGRRFLFTFTLALPETRECQIPDRDEVPLLRPNGGCLWLYALLSVSMEFLRMPNKAHARLSKVKVSVTFLARPPDVQ
jgi:hypothetical protein